MTTTYDPEQARRENDLALAAQLLTATVNSAGEQLAATIFGDWAAAEHMTCFEVDALALVLLAVGQRAAAERVIYVHSFSDASHERHAFGDDHPADFARVHADTLILRHAAQSPVFVRPDGDAPAGDPVWTVEIAGSERHDYGGSYLYALTAPDADTAAAYAMTVHLHSEERPDFDPATPDHHGESTYVVQNVTPGLKTSGYVNDMRAARFTSASDRRTRPAAA